MEKKNVQVIVQTWRPCGAGEDTSMFDRLKMYLLGQYPELLHDKAHTCALTGPNAVGLNQSKAGIRGEDSVEVFVRFNVAHQEFESNNLEVRKSTS